MHSLSAPCPYINYWPEDGSLELKHVATMYLWLHMCCVWQNKLLYHIVYHNRMAPIKKLNKNLKNQNSCTWGILKALYNT